MNLTLDLDRSAEVSVRLFALAVNLGMYPGVAAQAPTARVDVDSPDTLSLRLVGVDPESLLSLRRMLLLGGYPMPAALRPLAPARRWQSLEAILHSQARGLVSFASLGELSGDAFFLLVQGASSEGLYDVVQPVVAAWQQLLDRQGLPYRFDEDVLDGITTDGIEVYERSETEVEIATMGYGGGEDGVAALVNGLARQLQGGGLSFQMQGWTG